jgi:hypothetical protein
MKFIELDSQLVETYGWRKLNDGEYTDADGFSNFGVVAMLDNMSAQVVATVVWGGTPVLIVTAGDDGNYLHTEPLYEPKSPEDLTVAHFLYQIGAIGEDAEQYAIEHGTVATFEDEDGPEDVDDGHELISFVGVVAEAIHAAYPDDTQPPKGF